LLSKYHLRDQIDGMEHVARMEAMHTKTLVEKPEGRDYLGAPGVHGSIILKMTSKK